MTTIQTISRPMLYIFGAIGGGFAGAFFGAIAFIVYSAIFMAIFVLWLSFHARFDDLEYTLKSKLKGGKK